MNKPLPGLLLLIWLLLPALTRGQRQSRIVFFRIDATAAGKYSAAGEWRLYTDELRRDENPIAKMRSGSVFVYSAPSIAGSYTFVPYISGSSNAGRVSIPELNGGIVYVQVSLEGTNPIRAQLTAVEMDKFNDFYNHSKALRRHLNDAGYTTLEALSQNFSSIPVETVRSHGRTGSRRRPLNDTAYFDTQQKRSTRAAASTFSVATRDTGGMFRVCDYFLPGRGLKRSTRWTTLDSESREGAYRENFPNGRRNANGAYHRNLPDGLWSYYRDNPANHIWYTVEYRNGKREGMLRSYYANGRLKREELHQTVLLPGASTSVRGVYKDNEKDSLFSGRCYDSSGKDIPFTPFEILPVPKSDLGEFLSGILSYPKSARRNGIEGRVIVQFCIDSTGVVKDAKVVRHANDELDAEALRVINAMPRWKPGIQDDRPVSVFFSLPITFKLD